MKIKCHLCTALKLKISPICMQILTASGQKKVATHVTTYVEAVCMWQNSCNRDSLLLGSRYAEFQVHVTRRLEKVETQPNQAANGA